MKHSTKFRPLTAQRLKDLVLGAETIEHSFLASFIGNALIALSGFVLYSDKAMAFINMSLEVPERWAKVGMDWQTYVWFLSQTISPVLIIFGSILRPRTIMYIVPIYCYMLQLYWIFLDYQMVDDTYLQVYVVGTTVLVASAIFLLRWLLIKRIQDKIEVAKSKILKNEGTA